MRKIVIFTIILGLSLFLIPGLGQAESLTKGGNLGMNMHWALDAFDANGKTEAFIQNTGTKWVREHFWTHLLQGENKDGWLDRYDYVVGRYKKNGNRVVGMLAYGPNEQKPTQVDDIGAWKRHVKEIVKRYKGSIKVWQIWNEPDSPDYLQHNSPEAYRPILKAGYEAVKEADPDATVLSAGISYPNQQFIERMYQLNSDTFDHLAVHLYYCREFNADRSNTELEDGLNNLYENVIKKYRPDEKIWITEMGCSTEGGISENLQNEYLQAKVPYVADLPYVDKVFLYTYRDRVTSNNYENNFGFVNRALEPKPVFWWYNSIPKGPYNQFREFPYQEAAKAEELKKGLEKYFGSGEIPISATNWNTVVNSYIYGGYPIDAIAKAIRTGGHTVHPSIPWEQWKQTEQYKTWIAKDPFK
ncbi:glycosyl hydrolase [Patescibacteria group bacterium]